METGITILAPPALGITLYASREVGTPGRRRHTRTSLALGAAEIEVGNEKLEKYEHGDDHGRLDGFFVTLACTAKHAIPPNPPTRGDDDDDNDDDDDGGGACHHTSITTT
jgi:hypothetical protein